MGSNQSKSKKKAVSAAVPGHSRRVQSSKDAEKSLRVWYRHSGQAEIDELPDFRHVTYKEVNEAEIAADVGDHHITHLMVKGDLPTFDVIGSHITHLIIRGLTDNTQLDRLANLKQLQVLHLRDNDFSGGLPLVVTKMASLNKLMLERCKLVQLPAELANLKQLQELHLSGNNFYGGLPLVVTKLTSLNTLWLYGCKLRQLPAKLANLKQLQVLALNYNNFSDGLPLVVTKMASLNKLVLWSCELRQLPAKLANLKQLQELNLVDNNFSGGLPLVVTKLTSLNTLWLWRCGLRQLPAEFSNLQELRELNLMENEFTELPPPVYKLNKLQTLDIYNNYGLTRIEKEILQLTNLTKLEYTFCDSLTHPPKAVCDQGLHAVRKYFTDLEQSKEIKWSSVPVAVVGTSLSGKTSLIRSLQERKRQLTFRDKTSPKDETTKVFKVEDLHFDKFAVKFVDYGGQEVYHVAYNIAKKDHCLPIAVVNIKEFKKLADAEGFRDATKKLVFDWLSHLYITNPRLGAPILVLTHTDELTPAVHEQCKEALLKEAEEIREDILEEEGQLPISSPQHFRSIDHFKRTDLPLISAADVFELDNDLQKTENINNLLTNLKQRCDATSTVIPEQWDSVAKFLESEEVFHLTLSDVSKKFPMEGLDVVLRYLHNCGAILWFREHSQLSGYVFHNVPAIVDMIALLFHHSADEQWKQSIANYRVFFHNGESIGKERYAEMVEEFTQSGMMAEALLVNLLKKHDFPDKVALDLLQAFHILHGPMTNKRTPQYAIPSIAKSVMPAGWESDGRLQLRFDMLFKGLSPPKYVFHLITVAVLNFTASPLSVVDIWRNGATVHDGECAIHLLHDYMSLKITLQVSTPVNNLGMSWKKLLQTIAHIVSMLQQTWPASRIETQVYCAHCLLVGEKTPSCVVHPDWLYSEGAIDANNIQTFSGVELVACKNSKDKANRRVPVVPCPLVFPCYDLSEEDIQKLERYISKLKVKKSPQGKVLPAETPLDNTSTTSAVSGPSTAAQVPQPSLRSADGDSDLSDSIDYLDESNETLHNISLHINVVTRPDIKQLFTSEKVYTMTAPTRGRCLIINNKQFEGPSASGQVQLSERLGSEMDVKNLKGVFRQLSFEWDSVYNDLSSQNMLRVIKEETQRTDHDNYGMFVLVIMTHGNATQLYGSDGGAVNLSEVYDLMSPYNFKRMAGKPKWLIIQACSGERSDTMGAYSMDSPSSPAVQPAPSPSTQHTTDGPEPFVHLATDDMFITRASFHSYISTRHPHNGTWFVRALVEALLKHSNHRDVQTLFEKQVKKKVRAKSLEFGRYGQTSGQIPTMECFPTKDRKLYLFPGYNPRI